MMTCPRFLAALAAALLLGAAPAFAQNPANVKISRSVSGEFRPGETLSVKLTITGTPSQGDPLLALGVYESIPAGTTYNGITDSSGDAPGVKPTPPVTGGTELNFAWIEPPALPYSFTYSLAIAEDAVFPLEIRGHVEYRLSGSALFSDIAITTLEESPAWKSGLLAGCGAGKGSGPGAWTDLLLVAAVALVLLGARVAQPRMLLEKQRTRTRR
jgi:hypothetical protein